MNKINFKYNEKLGFVSTPFLGVIFVVLVVISTLLYIKFNNDEIIPKVVIKESIATSTDLIVEENLPPYINNISPASGPVGTMISLNGENLAGFEGDLDAWIESSAGDRAYLPSASSSYPRTDLITVKIESKLCKQSNSYTGNPCAEFMSITSGKYKIYTTPWGKASNKVEFEVI